MAGSDVIRTAIINFTRKGRFLMINQSMAALKQPFNHPRLLNMETAAPQSWGGKTYLIFQLATQMYRARRGAPGDSGRDGG